MTDRRSFFSLIPAVVVGLVGVVAGSDLTRQSDQAEADTIAAGLVKIDARLTGVEAGLQEVQNLEGQTAQLRIGVNDLATYVLALEKRVRRLEGR